ncbi:dephospho-CoA kinase [Vibrio nitrifigilis]|uniref:Dephospho-CoA kinase n=1 Tax=Vibrio nitrifigilis TaxID=2789781 RepID=A0ABS0GH09_9VIBR|nr:dephospho-CoA kinase [Vibrio nitrifigilis]MBF9001600.1 dephospho-CoA kinase [Vibrio nitrifigilis]
MSFIIGLTGGIASGKTTVANIFHQHFAIDIVDADIVAREVVAPGTPGLKAIVDHFGEAILTEQYELNRAKLREKIFLNTDEKEWLNKLLHPMIRQQMLVELAQVTSPYALLVVPLLVENNLGSMANRILVVDVPEAVQLRRTMQRDNVDEHQARSILAAQASRDERLACADDVINNNLGNDQLLPQITELHQKYLALSKVNR